MRFSDMRSLVLASFALWIIPVKAGDLGTIGPVFRIEEPDMLEWIENKVKAKVESGEYARLQQKQNDAIQRKLFDPPPLQMVSKATEPRTIYYDPTFVVDDNIKDGEGRILVPAGTTINPLDKVSMSRSLIFFDARDRSQVLFAKKYIDKMQGLVNPVLVGGKFFDLMKEWDLPVYFDQKASLIRRFGIRQVPAIVIQEGRRLRIDEIVL